MLNLTATALPPSALSLRSEVRVFLKEHQAFLKRPNSDFTSGYDPEFSRLLGAQGWIGMTWPAAVGGGDRSYLERYVVTEELLAAGAPVAAHWIADRQTGPLLLRFGSPAQQARFLPSIAAGESFFSIGMSEPGSGSDLASVATRAEPQGDGFVINGTKLWSTGAHRNHYLVALVRTGEAGPSRHGGLSQLIIDLRADDVQVRPIQNMSGAAEFNEIVFTDTFVPADRLVGALGNGWQQVTSELAFERSGPERFLSAFRVLVELVRIAELEPTLAQRQLIGRLAAHFMTLRQMSIAVASRLTEEEDVALEAALVKELGNNFEKVLPELVRLAVPSDVGGALRATLSDTLLLAPSFTLRGGTREILRGVIARGLGLR